MTGRIVGYCRVSTSEQSLDLQDDALRKAGCVSIYSDKASGASTDRPELARALADLQPGDVLLVWRLDRLGRSLQHLIETVQALHDRGVGFRTVQDGIDTTTSGGRLVFHIFGALAEFERSLIRERTRAGLEAARRRGRIGGRPRALKSEQVELARRLLGEGRSQEETARVLGTSASTLRRELKRG